MNPVFSRIHHVCIVVHDIRKTEAYYTSIGIGPWQDYPPLSNVIELEVPDREAFLQAIYRYVDISNLQIQLCQPSLRDCPQRRFLETHGEGVYHLGFEVPEINAGEAQARQGGMTVTMKGRRADGGGFTYFDTAEHAGGVVLEIRASGPTKET